MRYRGFVLLFLLAAAPAAAIEVGSETPVGGEAVADDSGFVHPAIATSGTDFLVVWVSGDLVRHADVYFRRFAWDGSPLDPLPRPLIATGTMELHPAAAWNGGDYLAIWSTPDAMFSRLVRPDGTLGEVHRIGNEPAFGSPGLVWNGSRFLAVWTTPAVSLGNRTLAVRLDENGVALEKPVQLPFVDWSPAILTAGDSFLIVAAEPVLPYTGGWSLVASRFPADLPPEPKVTIRTPTDISPQAWATDGSSAVFAWSWGGHLHTASVSNTGEILGQSRDLMPGASPFAMAWHLDHYILFVAAEEAIYALRLDRRGKLLDSAPTALPTRGGVPPRPLASNGSRWLMPFDRDILSGSSRPSRSFAITATHRLAPSFPVQQSHAIASNGLANLVVWSEPRDDQSRYEIFTKGDFGIVRVVDRGVFPAGIDIEFGPDHALITWAETDVMNSPPQSSIFGLRVSSSGVPLDPAPFVIATGTKLLSPPRLVWNGNEYLAIWSESNGAVRAARVAPSGSVVEPGGFVVSPRGVSANVAWNGERYLATWHEFRCGERGCRYSFLGSFVVAAEISAGGTVGPPFDVARAHKFGYGPFVEYALPTAVWNGRNWVIFWTAPNEPRYPVVPAIWSLALDESGTPPAGELTFGALIAETSAAAAPEVCRAGRTFLAVWQQQTSIETGDDIVGAQIDEGGGAGDLFVISRGSTPEWNPRLACSSAGDAAVVYQRVVPELGGPVRLFLRQLSFEQRVRPVRR